ncbi:MAG: PRC-barrel domain-containing protein [Betaproteobacteria bacterium]
MLRSAKEMEGYAVSATDGVIGHVKDFYLDDEKWVIRYLVVDTGGWLSSRKVLVSPIAVGTPDWEQKLLPVSISKEQVSKSPDIDTEQPVSRQHEIAYSGYYGYPYYWGGGGYWGGAMYPNLMMPAYGGFGGSAAGPADGLRETTRREMAQRESDRHAHDDPHLRSCNAVVGYHIHASDGDIGHVAGMMLDEQTWAVRYLIVDTSNWWLGHQVLIAPQWIETVNWLDATVSVSMSRQAVKDAPIYDAQAAISRDAEDRLYKHYGHAGYWTGYPISEDEASHS